MTKVWFDEQLDQSNFNEYFLWKIISLTFSSSVILFIEIICHLLINLKTKLLKIILYFYCNYKITVGLIKVSITDRRGKKNVGRFLNDRWLVCLFEDIPDISFRSSISSRFLSYSFHRFSLRPTSHCHTDFY